MTYKLLFLEFYQVDIFECGCVFKVFTFDFAVDVRTFQIENMFNHFVIRFFSVAHKNEVYRLHVFHLDTVDTVNASQERVLIKTYVLEITLEQLFKGVEITLSHCLYDKVFIVREKEERPTFTLGFTCFED